MISFRYLGWGFGLIVSIAFPAEPWNAKDWPILRHYDQDHLLRIALPLGGIGTGTVSLGGRGELRDWEIMNRPAKGFSSIATGNDAPFFSLYVRSESGVAQTRVILGPLDSSEYQHPEGRPVDHHGLPRFHQASFDAAYPFGQVNLADPSLPVSVRIKAFNPLIPGDADASSLPLAVLCYEVKNDSDHAVSVSVCGSLRNFIGRDGSASTTNWKGDRDYTGAKKNRNQFRKDEKIQGIYFTSEGVDPLDPAWGTMALVTEEHEGISYRTSSVADNWSSAMLDFWDDFSADGILTEKAESADDDPMASLAITKAIPAGATRSFTFFLAWHFPNRRAWTSFSYGQGTERIGNFYCQRFKDAWDAASYSVANLPDLEAQSLQFVRAVCESDEPAEIKEAALFNLATLRSQTVFRLPTGELMAWEGVMANTGSCFGSCTHVWNYEAATAFLYGDLARTMRKVEFGDATDDSGKMSFRVMLPLTKARQWDQAAADGQMGTIVKFYREWQLSGDQAFLDHNWSHVKSALAYAWATNGWDANQDGVMEGAQHNTMDVDYFGPNPQMQFWYLAALRAGARMAKAEGDSAFAARCESLEKTGSAWTDTNLFNGEYYEQKITDPTTHVFLDMSAKNEANLPRFQLGRGCLVDQIVGQTMARLCGLGTLAKSENLKATLRSIMRYNFRESFADHFNNMRTFVLGDEAGLLMASWPKGRLKSPFPYFNEAMTGFEYTAATGMIQEGFDADALKVIRSIRDRFDGRKRNPFNEPECGYHYGRSLASWNTLIAWTGFHYSAVDGVIGFGPRIGRHFWANGSAWGTCRVEKEKVTLEVLHGTLRVGRLELGSAASVALPTKQLNVGDKIAVRLANDSL
jgi:non-lysosomal glucosylceramidase